MDFLLWPSAGPLSTSFKTAWRPSLFAVSSTEWRPYRPPNHHYLLAPCLSGDQRRVRANEVQLELRCAQAQAGVSTPSAVSSRSSARKKLAVNVLLSTAKISLVPWSSAFIFSRTRCLKSQARARADPGRRSLRLQEPLHHAHRDHSRADAHGCPRLYLATQAAHGPTQDDT